jgi:hypothetical protein
MKKKKNQKNLRVQLRDSLKDRWDEMLDRKKMSQQDAVERAAARICPPRTPPVGPGRLCFRQNKNTPSIDTGGVARAMGSLGSGPEKLYQLIPRHLMRERSAPSDGLRHYNGLTVGSGRTIRGQDDPMVNRGAKRTSGRENARGIGVTVRRKGTSHSVWLDDPHTYNRHP